MKLYLAGPMTGYEHWNFPAFHAAAAKLRAVGYTVINPAELPIPPGCEGKDSTDDAAYVKFMRQCIPLVLESDGVATLDFWWESRGSRQEVQNAHAIKIPVIYVGGWIQERQGMVEVDGESASGINGLISRKDAKAQRMTEEEFAYDPTWLALMQYAQHTRQFSLWFEFRSLMEREFEARIYKLNQPDFSEHFECQKCGIYFENSDEFFGCVERKDGDLEARCVHCAESDERYSVAA